VSITDRDRKILFALIPLVLIAAYWFLLLAPKRHEATTIKDQLTQAEGERDTAVSKAAGLTGAKRNFGKDYATVIYLGKSIPASVDMPSLMVQLARASRGTGITFSDIKTGQRDSSSSSSSTPAGGGTGPASSSTPAQSSAGKAAQSAGGAVNQTNAASVASGGDTGTTGTGTSSAAGTGAPGLDSIPLDFQFDGSFFDLADFFHRMKRFVRVVNGKVVVRGRLMTINSWSFDTKDSGFPHVKALVHATVYLAPKTEGVSAGANPQGPSGSPSSAPAGQQTASTNPAPPAATVTAP
jgi:Tfp pilus assembly protein PilO